MQGLKQKLLSGGLVACFTIASLFSPAIVAAESNIQSGSNITSIYGYDQYETAAEIAKNGWSGTSDYAILAAGMPVNLIDALAAGPLAAKLNAPIILTEGNTLNKNAKDQLTRLKVKTVFITSGSAVIKENVINEVKTIASVTEVKSLGGYDASETSVNIAKEMANQGVNISKVVVAGGAGSDALSIAPIAGAQGMPILYTSKEALSNYVQTYLDGIRANITKTYIIGGTSVVSEAAKTQIPGVVERYYGQSLYDTNIEVFKKFTGDVKNVNTYVANGETLVDALAGAPLAVKNNSLILLTGKTMPEASKKFAQSNLSPNVIGLGGQSVVTSSVLAELAPTEMVSQDGSVKGSNDANNLEQINGILKITGNNVTIKNAKTDYSIYIKGNNVTLNNVTINGTIFIDPGVNGSATLQKVKATKVVMFSGNQQNIKLTDVIADTIVPLVTQPPAGGGGGGGGSNPVTPAAPNVTRDDTANTVSGMAVGMEYNLDNAGYVAYNAAIFDGLDLTGNHTILVRVAAKGINPAGPDTTLTFTTNPVTPTAPNVTRDDTANTVSGMAVGMEYNLDNAGYVAYNAAIFDGLDLTGNHTILVRVAAKGINPAGPDTTLTFTTNPVTPTAPNVTRDDTANTVSGMAVGMEYNLDNAGYVAYNAAIFDGLDLTGNHTILVRVAAKGINPAGPDTTLVFTTNPVSSDATLSDLKVNGISLPDFAATKLDYEVEIVAADTTSVPNVDAAVTATGKANAVVTHSLESTTVVVTAENGTTKKTYTINYVIEGVPTIILSQDIADIIFADPIDKQIIDKNILVTGDNKTIKNVHVNGTIFLNPGDDGTATLDNVEATKIVVLSGDQNSINLKKVIAQMLENKSKSPKTHISASDGTTFIQTQSSSSAIFENPDGSFGMITLTASSGEAPIVELIGIFETIEVNGLANATIILGEDTTITHLVTNSPTDIFIPQGSSITKAIVGSTEPTTSGGGTVANLATDTPVVDYSSLRTAVVNANLLLWNTSVGTEVGFVLPATHNAFKAVIDAADAVIDKTTQVQVYAQVAALEAATIAFNNGIITGIVADKTVLSTAIENANDLKTSKTVGTAVGNVTAFAYNAFRLAINAATAVKNDTSATQAQVDAQVAALASATTIFNNAVIEVVVDKTQLSTDLIEANNLLTSKTVGTAVGNITASAYDVLRVAINVAKAVNSDASATQAQVNAQVAALEAATTMFNDGIIITEVEADKTELTTALENANKLLKDTTVGTDVGNVSAFAYNVLRVAINAATAVKNDTSATQAQVNAQVGALALASTNFKNAIIVLNSIAITTQATKLIYNVGDTLDLTGLVVTGTYSNGSTKEIPVTATNVTGFNSVSPADSQELTITIGGKTTTYTVEIKAIVLTSIAIKTPTTAKLIYRVGETLDLTGLEVIGTYSDGSTKEETVTAANITGFDSTASAASQTLTITIGGKTTNYTIEVKEVSAVVLSSIAITTPATKLTYFVGDALDLSGLVVTGTYSDDSTKEETVSATNVSGFNSVSPAASQELTITIGGKTTTYTVEIKVAPVSKTALNNAVEAATDQIGSTAVGIEARIPFQEAINAAAAVLNNPDSNQKQVDDQVKALAVATAVFNNAVLNAPKLDISFVPGAELNGDTLTLDFTQLTTTSGIRVTKDSNLSFNIGAGGIIGDIPIEAGQTYTLLNTPLPTNLNLEPINVTAILTAIKDLDATSKQQIFDQVNFTKLFDLVKQADPPLRNVVFDAIDFNNLFLAVRNADASSKLSIFGNMISIIGIATTDIKKADFKAALEDILLELAFTGDLNGNGQNEVPRFELLLDYQNGGFNTTTVQELFSSLMLSDEEKVKILEDINYSKLFEAVKLLDSTTTIPSIISAINFTDIFNAVMQAKDKTDTEIKAEIYANVLEVVDILVNSSISKVDILNTFVFGESNKASLFQTLYTFSKNLNGDATMTLTLTDTSDPSNTNTYYLHIRS